MDRTECIIVRRDIYDRTRAPQPDAPLSIEEQRHMLRRIGEHAGWNDPEMDVYDELDPRRLPLPSTPDG